MSKTLTLKLDDIMYESLLLAARSAGREPREWATACLLSQLRYGTQSDEGVPVGIGAEEVSSSTSLNGSNSDYKEILRTMAESMATHSCGTPEEHIARFKENVAQKLIAVSTGEGDEARQRLYRHMGAVDSGDTTSADNLRIDDDLAKIFSKEM